MEEPAFFSFDIPEHLPSSPLCPANSKHKSKGRGICVVRHPMLDETEVVNRRSQTDGDILDSREAEERALAEERH